MATADIGTLNDYKVMVVKTEGTFVWHSHAETDDFFYVVAGQLTIQLRDRDVVLEAGELFVVPRGAEHCSPMAVAAVGSVGETIAR